MPQNLTINPSRPALGSVLDTRFEDGQIRELYPEVEFTPGMLHPAPADDPSAPGESQAGRRN